MSAKTANTKPATKPAGAEAVEISEDLIFTRLLYTAEQASQILGGIYRPEVLKRKASKGEIDGTRFGRSYRWSRANLEAIVAAHEVTAKNYGRKKSR